MGVELVDDAARGIQTVVRAVVRRQGLHRAAACLVNNRVAERREVVLEVGGTDDLDGIGKADLRLVLDRGGRIDLGARLAVGEEHVEPHAGRESRLAVLAGNLYVGIAETTCAVGILPAENVPEHEVLPRFEPEAATGPLTFGVLEALDETDCTQRRPAVEVPTAFECAVLIGIVTAHGKTDVFANQYAAVAYLFGIDLGGIFFRCCHTIPSLQTPRSHLSEHHRQAGPQRGGGSRASVRTPPPANGRWRARPRQYAAWG